MCAGCCRGSQPCCSILSLVTSELTRRIVCLRQDGRRGQTPAAAAYVAQASVLPAATAPAAQARLCRLAAIVAASVEHSGQPATALLEPALVALGVMPVTADRADARDDVVAACLERAVAVSDLTHAKAWWQLGTHLAEVAAGQLHRTASVPAPVASLIDEFGFGAASGAVRMR